MTGEVVQVTFTPGRVDGRLWLWLVRAGGVEAATLDPEDVTVDGVRAYSVAYALVVLHGGRCRATLGKFDPATAAYHSAAFERLGG